MSSRARTQQRQVSRDELVVNWGQEYDVDVERLDEGQKWLVFVALQLLCWIGDIAALKRLLGCFLSHSGMGLSSLLIGKCHEAQRIAANTPGKSASRSSG